MIFSGPGCITQFVPETEEAQELVVVEGLITNQSGANIIKISKSQPLGKKSTVKPLKGCTVRISDDQGHTALLTEKATGTYSTDPASFRGMEGRKYTLEILTNNATLNHYTYRSLPMEMKSVPPIDSIFYTKVLLADPGPLSRREEGCQVYLNTHDPEGKCKYYRWDFSETWEFRLPYSLPVNNVCWMNVNSTEINIKNISGLSENMVFKYPIRFISNETDRLKVKYSLLVNQYSLNEDEYFYWEKLRNVYEETGGLYDITPASIPGNIFCVEDPGEKVLGYFSVSARSAKRIFINENFYGIINLYTDCISDTIFGNQPIIELNSTIWALEQNLYAMPPYTVVTDKKRCADCTVRGTTTRPDFWDDDK